MPRGDADSGTKPGTRSEDTPDDWSRPDCGSPKANFQQAAWIGVIANFAPNLGLRKINDTCQNPTELLSLPLNCLRHL